MAILRSQGVLAQTGDLSVTSIYNRIKAGLFTKPVPTGPRNVGWPDYEVEIINAARIAGQSDNQIRELVNMLHAQRTERFKQLLNPPVPANSGNVMQWKAA